MHENLLVKTPSSSVLIVGDLHIADRHNSRRDDYFNAFVEKFRQIQQIAAERSIKNIIQLGDVFHFKAPTKTSHRIMKFLNQEISGDFEKQETVWSFLKGNHDQKDGNEDLVGQPFDLLMSFRGVQRIGGVILPLLKNPLVGLDFSFKLNVREELESAVPPFDQELPPILLTHQNIFPPDTAWFPGTIDISTIQIPIFGLINGHIHEGLGLWVDSGSGWNKIENGSKPSIVNAGSRFYLNPGSIMRGSIDEHFSKRDVGVYVLEQPLTGKPSLSVEFIPIRVQPSEEVFKIREHLNKHAKTDEFTLFKNAVTSASKKERNIRDSLLEFCKAAGTPPAVAEEANRYLEETLQQEA